MLIIIAKLQISPDLPVQQKKSGWFYIWVVVCSIGRLYAEIFQITPDLPFQQNYPGTRPDQTRPDQTRPDQTSQDFLKTFTGLSQDFHRTFSRLSQDFLRTF